MAMDLGPEASHLWSQVMVMSWMSREIAAPSGPGRLRSGVPPGFAIEVDCDTVPAAIKVPITVTGGDPEAVASAGLMGLSVAPAPCLHIVPPEQKILPPTQAAVE